MAELIVSDSGPGPARCKHCSEEAVGPCARCHEPVCGDCCVLTEGGAQVWAICLACERRGGRELSSNWTVVIGWVLAPIAVLALLLVALGFLFGR